MSAPSTLTTSATLKRIYRELHEIQSTSSNFTAYPIDQSEPYEWHFTLRGPDQTEFEGGIYHGRFTLPINYPFAPPSIYLLTPNGRFELNKKICLSISDYHPELWQPAWGIRTMIEGLRSFFPAPAAGAVGALDWPEDVRRTLAIESRAWKCAACGKSCQEMVGGSRQEDAGPDGKGQPEDSSQRDLLNHEADDMSATSPQPVLQPTSRSLLLTFLDSFGTSSSQSVLRLVVDIHLLAVVLVVFLIGWDLITHPNS